MDAVRFFIKVGAKLFGRKGAGRNRLVKRWRIGDVDCRGNFRRGINRDVLSSRDGCREGTREIESGGGYLSNYLLSAACRVNNISGSRRGGG